MKGYHFHSLDGTSSGTLQTGGTLPLHVLAINVNVGVVFQTGNASVKLCYHSSLVGATVRKQDFA